jgi:CubicO group peptidase (beta-lactamase class C family)
MRRRLFATGLLALATAAHAHAAATDPASAALHTLLDGARASHSDTMLVIRNGRVLGRYDRSGRPAGPLELMSVTKSVVALGIGQLLDAGRIRSLDQPVADFYLAWRQGPKATITIRMLMDHTSGLADQPRTDKVYAATDAVKLALDAPLVATPGKRWFYSNKAVNLLAGIIAKASGRPMDVFFRDGLFRTLGIHAGRWDGDAAGHPYVMAGLHLSATDLARLGELVAARGRWHGRQLISRRYLDQMLAPGAIDECGLLWWRERAWTHFAPDPAAFAKLRHVGVPEATVATLQKGLAGQHFDSDAAMRAGLARVLGARADDILRNQLIARGIGPYRLFKVSQGPVVAYEANGDGGQYRGML